MWCPRGLLPREEQPVLLLSMLREIGEIHNDFQCHIAAIDDLLILAHFSYRLDDLFRLHQSHLGHTHLGFVDALFYAGFDLVLYDVVDGQSQRFAGQGSRPGGISLGHGLGVELGAVRRRGAQDDYRMVGADALDRSLDLLLTFQVNAAC